MKVLQVLQPLYKFADLQRTLNTSDVVAYFYNNLCGGLLKSLGVVKALRILRNSTTVAEPLQPLWSFTDF